MVKNHDLIVILYGETLADEEIFHPAVRWYILLCSF